VTAEVVCLHAYDAVLRVLVVAFAVATLVAIFTADVERRKAAYEIFRDLLRIFSGGEDM
jgi:hypothetical protein